MTRPKWCIVQQKIGKHAKYYGLNPSSEADRNKLMSITNDIKKITMKFALAVGEEKKKRFFFTLKKTML